MRQRASEAATRATYRFGPACIELASDDERDLADLAAAAPGRSVELRVPPHGAVQLIAGPVHRRGTPKATVELDVGTLVDLASGAVAWHQAVAEGRVLASGERADLGGLFPL